jgi:hypothetical protein
MDANQQQNLVKALTILSGGLAGALFSFGANSWLGWWRRFQLHRKLRIESPVVAENRTLSVRVVNGHVYPLTCCWAYITLDHELTDVQDPPEGKSAHITRQFPLRVVEDRLCWSVNPGFPPVVDILPGESQSLQILEFDREYNRWIGIFAETRDNPYRVFLLGGSKVYKGRLKIVCKEMRAKTQEIRIDLGDLMKGDLARNFLAR